MKALLITISVLKLATVFGQINTDSIIDRKPSVILIAEANDLFIQLELFYSERKLNIEIENRSGQVLALAPQTYFSCFSYSSIDTIPQFVIDHDGPLKPDKSVAIQFLYPGDAMQYYTLFWDCENDMSGILADRLSYTLIYLKIEIDQVDKFVMPTEVWQWYSMAGERFSIRNF